MGEFQILLPSYNVLLLQLKKSALAMVEPKSVLSRILPFIIGQFQWNEINLSTCDVTFEYLHFSYFNQK